MRAKLKRPRLPRIDREDQPRVVEDDNANLWAVSYSDFLMTVLSFFILFYSVEDTKKKTFILNLAKEFSTSRQLSEQNGISNDGKPQDSIARMPTSIAESLRNLNVKIDHDNEVLIVNFVDNMFTPGGYKIAKANEAEIKDLLTRIKLYDGKVNLYFEGHADSNPFIIHRNSILTDNFVLSSLRAGSALAMAREIGFSEKNLFIQADSSNIRDSRSLSIRIEPKGGIP